MEEVTGKLVEAFVAFHEMNTNPAAVTQEKINEISTTIDNCAKDYFSIYAFIHIIKSHPDTMIRYYAVTNFGLAFKYNWINNDKQTEILTLLFNILATEENARIREGIVARISKLTSEFLGELCIQFARDAMNSQSPIHLLSAVNLIASTAKLYSKEDPIPEFLRNLAKLSISLGDTELTLASYDMIYKYYIESQADNNDDIQEIFQSSVQLLPQYFENKQLFSQLCRIISNPLDLGADFTPLENVTEIILDLFNREADPAILSDCVQVIDALMSGYPEFMSQQEFILPLYNRYVEVASANFIEGAQLVDQQLVDIFQYLVSSLSLNSDFLEHVWSSKDALMESEAGQVICFLTTEYAMPNGHDFYENILDELVDFIDQGLHSEFPAVFDTTVACLNVFIDQFEANLEDYASLLEESLLDLIEQHQNFDSITILDCIFRTVKDSDNIFERALNLFVALVETVPKDLRYICIRAIADLSKSSQSLIEQYAEQVFNIVNMIIQADEDSELNELKPEAVSVLGILISRVPQLFASNLEEISSFVIESWQSETDPTLVIDSLNTFGYMINTYQEQIISIIPDALQIISQLSKQDKTKDLVDLTAALAEQAMVTDQEGEDTNENNIFANEDEYKIAGASCLLYGNILMTYSDLLQQYIEDFLGTVSILTDSVLDFSISYAMRGLSYVIEAMGSVGFFDPEVIKKIMVNAHSAAESNNSDNVACAIEVYAVCVCVFGLEHLGEEFGQIIDILDSVVRLNHACYDGNLEIPEGSFGPVRQLFREIFAVFDGKELPEEVTKMIDEAIIPLLDKSSEQAAFSLGVLSRFVESQNVSDEFATNVLERALNTQLKFAIYEGFYFIKCLAIKKPEIIQNHADYIKQLFHTKLTQKGKSASAYMMMKDNLVTCFGQIVMNIPNVYSDDELPLYFDRILDLMPANEDHREDASMLEFFFWIAQRYNVPEKLAAVLIRFFAMPKEILVSTGIGEEQIGTIKLALNKLLQQIPNYEQFIMNVCKNDEIKIAHVSQMLN